MHIKTTQLNKKFEEFKKFVELKSEEVFSSFDNKYIDEQENYKKLIYSNSVDIMRVDSWKEEDIGTGSILQVMEKVIAQDNNNLLIHDNRRGESAREDIVFVKARKNKDLKLKLESVLFKLYKNKIEEKDAFEELLDIAGKNYRLLSFLFFIKSSKRYLPIAPRTFDKVFNDLDINLRTSQKCSWENYINFINILKEVKVFLLSREEIKDEIALLDAHTFLWIIGRQMKEIKRPSVSIESDFASFRMQIININGKREYEEKDNNSVVIKNEDEFEKEAARKRMIGRESQEIVINYEINNLIEAGRRDLAKKINDLSNEVSRGYDILSFYENGDEKHIEVKTKSSNNSFYITKNELKISKRDKNYLIYIVDKRKYIIFNLEFNDLEKDYQLVPLNFKVYF